ncbi:MAG: signal recognition particle-docking protein FtsY [Bacteroidales bacterium]|nr:signal recognition particle-docking protein FtsY [Bacteroidales bacterium]
MHSTNMALSFFQKIGRAVLGKSRVDDNTLDAIEEALVESDMGVDTTLKVIDSLEERVEKDKYMSFDELVGLLREEISALIPETPAATSLPSPYVVLVVGVNGVGKTTTIGKLANYYSRQGKKVIVGAADTFRAAAVDQLSIWAERAGVDIVKQAMGADPASVAFDSVSAAVARKADVVLIDTAGRLHNRIDLMNELTKIRNVIRKVVPDGPHDVMLVLDASTGQNAFQQAREFSRATDITSLVVTKLDGTAKGGVVVGVSDQFGIPVKFIGVGEGIDDIRPFDKASYVEALFKPEDLK